jgi:diguanylate cyclase (GGDEF)-like protein
VRWGLVPLLSLEFQSLIQVPQMQTILVIEDESIIRENLLRLLKAEHFRAIGAEDGRVGLQLAQTQPPDLILCDILMPQMDGYEVLKHLQQNPATAPIPFLFLTAKANKDDFRAGMDLGADDYLTKPFTSAQVLKAIATRLNKQFMTVQPCTIERQEIEIQLQQQLERERLMGTITQRIRQSLNLEEILSATAAEVRQFLQADRVLVYRFRPDWSGTITVESSNPDCTSLQGLVVEDDCFGKRYAWLYQQGRVQATSDIYSAGLAPCHVDFLAALQVKANLVVPILQGSNLWGLLIAHHCVAPRIWQSWEIDLLKQLSGQVAIAVQQSELYQQSQNELSERKRAEAQLLRQAFHDALTGLPNRALFLDQLKQAIRSSKQQSESTFALLFLDFDRFKVVNDSLGHEIGDQFLKQQAHILKSCIRPSDTVARLGGDEFIILLNGVQELSQATTVAERIQQAFRVPCQLGGCKISTSVSIGIVLSNPEYEQPEDLIRDADAAMYQAKAQGKARYEVFTPGIRLAALRQLHLEADLRRAVEQQEFQLHYQPIVSLSTGRLTGFEALVRWQHPQKGLISPAEFIPIAEETGLIVSLGHWVLWEACTQLKQWQEQLELPQYLGATAGSASPLTVSVNLSAKQFAQPNLVEQIHRVLSETGLDASSLRVEITESVIMENIDLVAEKLLPLRSLGIEFYIDDFGTGYSSLSYLQRLPVDALKIDRSFISRLGTSEENLEIVRTIVSLAQNLKMNIIAEGIETAEQLAELRALNCGGGQGQGYFFSKPLDTQAATALIAQKEWNGILGQKMSVAIKRE